MIETTRRGALTLLLTLWQVSTTAVRVFVWGSIRENAIDLRPLTRTIRLIGLIGLALIATFLLGLLFSDSLRVHAPLTLLPNDSSSTRGLSVPTFVIPLTMLAIAIGWGYMLAGALHARALVRWLVLGVFALQILFPIVSQVAVLRAWMMITVLMLVLALLTCFVALPRINLPLPLEWSMVLALCGGLLVVMLIGALRLERLSGTNWLGDTLSGMLLSQFLFVIPFLIVSGLGWADFAIEASGWVARAAQRHAASPVLTILVLALLGYRLYGMRGQLGERPIGEQLAAWAGAGLLLAGLLLIGVWRFRHPPGGAVPARLVTSLALLLPALQIMLIIAPTLLSVPVLLQITPMSARTFSALNAGMLWLSGWEFRVRPLLLVVVGAGIVWAGRRRGKPTLAAFGLILAWTQLCRWLTGADGPLTAWRFTYSDVDQIGLAGLTLVALVYLARRRLTSARALRLLAIIVLMALLNQTAFLDNPFSPLFSFAGVAFLAFGIVWNVLTAGQGFANGNTPGLPRESRLLLYLGYVLLSVSISHWYLVSHNITMQDRQNVVNTLGFLTIGLPLAYLVVVELGEPLLRDEPLEARPA
jgi:hypothetical protein